jgi:gamma-glutamyltranspeptidase / glutathione hydrolase
LPAPERGMRGAIAAGHPLTAEVGATVLAEGGNAVDACIAAAFASWVVESPLTGPGGGGFMLVHRARDRTTRLLDFFVSVPGLGRTRTAAEMESVDVDFDSETAQVFHIGSGSCAVPGNAAGLEAAHRAFGSLPWARLVEPAVQLAHDGFELTRQQAYLHAILDVILRHTPEGRRVYRKRAAGERLRLPDLGDTLERIAARGTRDLYHGELARTIVAHLRETGGVVSSADLHAYRVIRRRPLSVRFRGHEVLSNPPPSSGGVLIAYGLALLDRMPEEEHGTAAAIARLAEVMREQTLVRQEGFGRGLYRGGLASRLLSDARVKRALERVKAVSSTTHISAVDEAGNAASLSASAGSGSGVIVPGTGIHLNNMLGEYDLKGPARPGGRLTSMMAPSLVLRRGRPRLVVGSAGSARLRGAIMQVIVNVVEHSLGVEDAITAPRVHLDEGHLHCEGGTDAAAVDELEARGYDVVRWRRRNLYFGGVSAVEAATDESRRAAGDPRRGGDGIVVDGRVE